MRSRIAKKHKLQGSSVKPNAATTRLHGDRRGARQFRRRQPTKPFRYFKFQPEVVRRAVIMYVLRFDKTSTSPQLV